MQVIRTRSLASRLRWLVIWAVIVVGLVFIAAVMNETMAQTSPSKIPPEVMAQGNGVHTVDKGRCQRPEGPRNCMYGLHVSMTYAIILVYNDHGVLVQVIRINDDAKERLLWQHPAYDA